MGRHQKRGAATVYSYCAFTPRGQPPGEGQGPCSGAGGSVPPPYEVRVFPGRIFYVVCVVAAAALMCGAGGPLPPLRFTTAEQTAVTRCAGSARAARGCGGTATALLACPHSFSANRVIRAPAPSPSRASSRRVLFFFEILRGSVMYAERAWREPAGE